MKEVAFDLDGEAGEAAVALGLRQRLAASNIPSAGPRHISPKLQCLTLRRMTRTVKITTRTDWPTPSPNTCRMAFLSPSEPPITTAGPARGLGRGRPRARGVEQRQRRSRSSHPTGRVICRNLLSMIPDERKRCGPLVGGNPLPAARATRAGPRQKGAGSLAQLPAATEAEHRPETEVL